LVRETPPPNRAGREFDGRATKRCFRLSLERDPGDLEKARRLVDEIRGLVDLSDERAFDVKVALGEACANGMEHAKSAIAVVAWLLPDRLLLEITNDGWSILGLQKDRDRNQRGWGLPLMTALADQVHIARLEGGFTRVSLTFFLTPVASRPAATSTAGKAPVESGEEPCHGLLDSVGAIVEAFALAPTLPEAAAALLDGAMALTRCDGGMVRLREGVGRRSGWLPAIVHRGLSERFLAEEALIRTDECMCGRVCMGLADPSLPFFALGGSFVWGKAQTIAAEFPGEVLGEVRGRCIEEGFESVAAFPLQTPEGPVGVLHLVDFEKDKFEETAAALERGCRLCGAIMLRAGGSERRIAVRRAVEVLRAG
jgi:anti-sigma regulatory factor (Ser/Thr protein kinase)